METIVVAIVSMLFGMAVTAAIIYPILKARVHAESEGIAREVRSDYAKRSSATLKGQIGERFAPFVPGFGYEPADARFLGSPIDYVVFDGLAAGQIKGVAFVEVKTGSARLTPFQQQVQEAIAGGRVDWRVLELPD